MSGGGSCRPRPGWRGFADSGGLGRALLRGSEPRRAPDAHASTGAGVVRRLRWLACKRSAFAGAALASSLVQKPGTSLGLVDPDFDQAGGGNVAMFVADVVRFAQTRGEFLVLHALHAADMPDGLERGSTDLAYPLGDGIGHREQLIRLFIEQQMVVTEVRAA